MKLGDKVMRLPETFTDSGEDKRSLRWPVAGRVVYIHPKGTAVTSGRASRG